MNSFVLHKFSETGFPFNRNFAANLVGSTESVSNVEWMYVGRLANAANLVGSTESVSNLVGSTESVSNVEWMDVGRLAAT